MDNQLEKSKVTNGCNGSCCEKFTLPFTIEHLIEMQGKEDISSRDKEDLPKVIEMIIPLGQTDICPQFKKPFKELANNKEWVNHFPIKKDDGTLMNNIYTCKHFDKENKVCNNYENRPNMCKRFGNSCAYEGCCYREKTYSNIGEMGIKCFG